MRASVPPQRKPSFAVASGAARARDADDVPDGPADPSPSPEKTPRVASSARSEKPLLETLGFAALTDPALAARRATNPVPPACTHKRCRMCGNVCNVRVTACTSCCLPLVDRVSWDPAQMPRPGAASDSSDSSDDSSDDDAEKDDDDDNADGPPGPLLARMVGGLGTPADRGTSAAAALGKKAAAAASASSNGSNGFAAPRATDQEQRDLSA